MTNALTVLVPIGTALVFILWFSPLGRKVGVFRWPKSQE